MFSSTVAVAGATTTGKDGLSSPEQRSLEMATAASLGVSDSAVSFKDFILGQSSIINPTPNSTTITGASVEGGLRKLVDVIAISAVLDVSVTISATQNAAAVYSILTASMASAVSSGAFTTSLRDAAASFGSASFANASVVDVSVSSYSTQLSPADPKLQRVDSSSGASKSTLIIVSITASVLMLALTLAAIRCRYKLHEQELEKRAYELRLTGLEAVQAAAAAAAHLSSGPVRDNNNNNNNNNNISFDMPVFFQCRKLNILWATIAIQ